MLSVALSYTEFDGSGRTRLGRRSDHRQGPFKHPEKETSSGEATITWPTYQQKVKIIGYYVYQDVKDVDAEIVFTQLKIFGESINTIIFSKVSKYSITCCAMLSRVNEEYG